MSNALTDLAAELRAERSVISPHVADPADPAALGDLVAAGPAARGHERAYATVIESVREGYLLHYGTPRLVAPPDPDLALLAGDYLYAKGLERLAALGDLAAVRELADLISISAQLHAEPEPPGERVAALWLASAVAISGGRSPAHERAKASLGEGGGAAALYQSAAEAAAGAGIGEQLSVAAETVGFRPHLG